jgi:hypothetical protein
MIIINYLKAVNSDKCVPKLQKVYFPLMVLLEYFFPRYNHANIEE